MEYVALGRTNILASRASLAAHSIKLLDARDQEKIIRAAYDAGINYFGLECGHSVPALAGAFIEIRQNVFLGLRAASVVPRDIKAIVEDTLTSLNTDYIDILHIADIHADIDGYAGALESLKTEGKIRFAGIADPFRVALNQIPAASVFDTLQIPFNLLSGADQLEKIRFCAKRDFGCLVSEPLCAPFEEIEDAYLFLRRFEHVVPLWEVRSAEQMDMLLNLVKTIEG